MPEINTNPIKKKKSKSDFWNQAELKAKIQSNQKSPTDAHIGAGDAFSRAQAARENLHSAREHTSAIASNPLAERQRVSALGKYVKKAARAVKKAATTAAFAGVLHTAPATTQSQTLATETKPTSSWVTLDSKNKDTDKQITSLAEKLGQRIKDVIKSETDSVKKQQRALNNKSQELDNILKDNKLLKTNESVNNISSENLKAVAMSTNQLEIKQKIAEFQQQQKVLFDNLVAVKGINDETILAESKNSFIQDLQALKKVGVSQNTLGELESETKGVGFRFKEGEGLRGQYHISEPLDSVYLWPESIAKSVNRSPEIRPAYQQMVARVGTIDIDKFIQDPAIPALIPILDNVKHTLRHETLGQGLTSRSYTVTVGNFLSEHPGIKKDLPILKPLVVEGGAEIIALGITKGLGQKSDQQSLSFNYKNKFTPYYLMAVEAVSADNLVPYDNLLKIDDNFENQFLYDQVLPKLALALQKNKNAMTEIAKKYELIDSLYNNYNQNKTEMAKNKLDAAIAEYNKELCGENGLWQRFARDLDQKKGNKIYQSVLDEIGPLNLTPEQFSVNIVPAAPAAEMALAEQTTTVPKPIATPRPVASAEPATEKIPEQKIIAPKILSEEEIKNQLAGTTRADKFDNEKEIGLHPPQIEKPLLASDKVVLPPPSAGARPLLQKGGGKQDILTGRVDSLSGKFSSPSANNKQPVLRSLGEGGKEQQDYGLGGRLMNKIQPGWQEKVGSQLSNATGGMVGGEDLEFAMDLMYDNLDRTFFNPATVMAATLPSLGTYPIFVLFFMLFFRLPHGFELGMDKQKLKMTAKWATIIATSGAGAGAAAGAEAGGASAAMKGAQTAGTMAEKGGLSSVGTSKSFTQELTAGEGQSTEQKIVDELKSRQQQSQNAQGEDKGGDSGVSGIVWGFFKRKYRWTVPEPIFSTILAFFIVLIELVLVGALLYLLGVFGDIFSGFSGGVIGTVKGIITAVVKGIDLYIVLGKELVSILIQIAKGVTGL